jgi:lambda family phage tail tape measure protein
MATTIDRYKLIVDTKGAQSGIRGIAGSLKGLGPLIAGAFSVAAVLKMGQTIIAVGKEYEKYNNQLKLVTANAADLSATFDLVQQSANRSGAALGEAIDLFSKLKLSTEALGKSTKSVVKVAETFSKALKLSGADANTANGAIRQFGQAMASGTVRGDEFTSIVEALGPALAIMARESGMTIGSLRKLSQEGGLTAEVFYNMVEATKSIDEAFASLNLTTEQIETNLGKTFDEVIKKIDEAAGFTSWWSEQLSGTNRKLADLFNTSQSLENLSLDDLRSNVEDNTLRIDEALIEIQGRFNELNLFDAFTSEGNALRVLAEELRALKDTREVANTARKAQAALDIAEDLRIQALLKPYKELNIQLDGIAKAYTSGLSSLQRLNLEQERVKAILDDLLEMRNTEIATNSDLEKSITSVQNRYTQLGDEIKTVSDKIASSLSNSENYFKDLIATSTDSVNKLGFAKDAIASLDAQVASGAITQDVYNEALKRVNNTLGIQVDLEGALQDRMDNRAQLTQSLQDLERNAKNELEKLNLNPFQRQLADIENDLDDKLVGAIRNVKTQWKDGLISSDEYLKEIQILTQAAARTGDVLRETATQSYNQQRTFSQGWKEAFEDYEDEATNAAKKAEEVFTSATKGMEDSIVGFAKTGKFEFKSLVSDILEQLLRSQIQSLIASTFKMPFGNTGGSVGGGIGGIFDGFFANGGTLGAGKFGIAGEAGPELISGPATITPLTGGNSGNVTYNINAVDALSFRQLVARDPGFIHAVAMKGGSKVPQGR